ncbi:MAG: hypothetical protein U1E27_12155 [Kiritimatiellia bacterium]|nr:hypothetical protein [Kiritimatiellia bacterium]
MKIMAPARRYLSGADWMMAGLAHAARRLAKSGNHFQIVLDLEGAPDVDAVRRGIRLCVTRNPVLQGRARRAWNGVPYWKPGTVDCAPPDLVIRDVHPGVGPEDTILEWERHLLAPVSAPGGYLSFLLLRAGSTRSSLAVRFDHRLFDALGAETFLAMFARQISCEGGGEGCVEAPPAPSGLRPWGEKFANGRELNRMRLRHRSMGSYQLPVRPPSAPAFHCALIHLDASRTRDLMERSEREAGYLMFTPFLAACALRSFHEVARRGGSPLAGVVLPCSVSMGNPVEVYFNHLSFITLAASAGQIAAPLLARDMARQMYGQKRDGWPDRMESAWKLLRILPATLYGRLLSGPMRSLLGSFSLGYVGDGLAGIETIAGCRVLNAYHVPSVPPIPGVGFFVNRFRDRVNVCVTTFNGALEKKNHIALAAAFRRELTDPAPKPEAG